MCFFFLFQAEDGIRDIGVTGVQTCALPILPAGEVHPVPAGRVPIDRDPGAKKDDDAARWLVGAAERWAEDTFRPAKPIPAAADEALMWLEYKKTARQRAVPKLEFAMGA